MDLRMYALFVNPSEILWELHKFKYANYIKY